LVLPDNIRVTFAPGEHTVSPQALEAWIDRARRAIIAYYGKFPVPSLDLHVSFAAGRNGVSHGKTWGDRGAVIRISVGQYATEADLNDDWMLVHEMVHLALPSLGDRQHWLEEGSATYVEPIARVLIGNLTPQRVWHDVVRDMPQGVPKADDRGLDFTQSWASTYWGGALFCLLADVEIRKRTKGKKGLQQAFGGVLRAGGNILVEWPIERVLKTGDAAVGANTLQNLYKQLGLHYMKVDLPALWKQLGVVWMDGRVTFDDSAPLAYVRRAITPQ
jgi:hypothetical protein